MCECKTLRDFFWDCGPTPRYVTGELGPPPLPSQTASFAATLTTLLNALELSPFQSEYNPYRKAPSKQTLGQRLDADDKRHRRLRLNDDASKGPRRKRRREVFALHTNTVDRVHRERKLEIRSTLSHLVMWH